MSSNAEWAVVRPMTAADLGRVMEIAGSLKEAPAWPLAAWEKALEPESAPRRVCLVAEDRVRGEAAGFAVASLLGEQAELESIGVAAESQRRGLGRLLFGALAAQLKAAWAGEVILEVRDSNRAARGLYRSLGFVESGRRRRYYHDPEEDAVLMALRLG